MFKFQIGNNNVVMALLLFVLAYVQFQIVQPERNIWFRYLALWIIHPHTSIYRWTQHQATLIMNWIPSTENRVVALIFCIEANCFDYVTQHMPHFRLMRARTTWRGRENQFRTQTACFVSEYLRDRRIRVRIGIIVSDEFYPEEGVPTGGVLAVTCFGLKIN